MIIEEKTEIQSRIEEQEESPSHTHQIEEEKVAGSKTDSLKVESNPNQIKITEE